MGEGRVLPRSKTVVYKKADTGQERVKKTEEDEEKHEDVDQDNQRCEEKKYGRYSFRRETIRVVGRWQSTVR